MSLPLFYIPALTEDVAVLPEETSKHVIQVLRMQQGDKLQLTDGKGSSAEAIIAEDNRKRTTVIIQNRNFEARKKPTVTIAVSLLKNTSRFEWFLEKATELGISEIIPLQCERTEKEKFRLDRLQGILISAMLQSQQVWLPKLFMPMPFNEACNLLDRRVGYIAHCMLGTKTSLASVSQTNEDRVILIGPEGDFTAQEINLAIDKNFLQVSLGSTRLRTETAAMVAAVLLANASQQAV